MLALRPLAVLLDRQNPKRLRPSVPPKAAFRCPASQEISPKVNRQEFSPQVNSQEFSPRIKWLIYGAKMLSRSNGPASGAGICLEEAIQKYLTYERTQPPRTLPKAYAKGPRVVLGGWVFSYERGTPAAGRGS